MTVGRPVRREARALTLLFKGGAEEGLRALADETPVQVSYADLPFGVMMMTPADLDDFAYGFSLTEGIITSAADVRALSILPSQEGLALRIDLVGARLGAHLARQRALSGRTSCGLCGITDLAQVARVQGAAPGAAPLVDLRAIEAALHALDSRQPLNAATRAVHGAAWCALDGRLVHVREDVGRHNALDKLVGALLREGSDPADGFVLITSRASFEMVEKIAAFGARTLVAISAPTSLALARAQALDVTLVAIARRDGVTVFHGAERVIAG